MKAKILLIDDDTSLRRVIEYNLQEEGYEVFEASSGEDGLKLFREVRADIVITDMKMSGIDGLSVLRAIKELSSETLVIIITAFGQVDVAVEAMKAGAFDYILKPFSRDALRLTVTKAVTFCGLAEENRRLRSELADKADFHTIIGSSKEMEKVFGMIRKVADTEAAVLITGESGTGKELVARAIHANSSRRDGPFVTINCAAIPRDLLESELFGHTRGAFTGAIKEKAGKFQLADGGTIFLDEVGELLPELQPKLLRVLQEKEVDPIGASKAQKVDVRVVSATNRDIETAVSDGRFREDLFYRLAVIEINLPPLRQRRADIPLLIRYFCSKYGKDGISFEKEALDMLSGYPWPGNVRELQNTVERLIIMRNGDSIGSGDLPDKFRQGGTPKKTIVNLPDEGCSLEELEREIVVEALERNGWNQTAAARFLRIPRHVLIYRLEKYGIGLPDR
ncbi:MAG: sigma-54-dependent Fis family transcriptional regulator [Chlorobiaceae bacterium]|nr:sigma-54-dependent Fis family transcriptional regulator [Chlorobiaceae bacterium]